MTPQAGRSLPVLAFLAPMPAELRPLRRALRLEATDDHHGPVLTGALQGRPVVAALTGMGTERAARRATEVLDRYEIDQLVVIGVAGAIGAGLRPGDVVVPEVVADLDAEEEFRPSEHRHPTVAGTLATSDDFITDPDRLGELRARGVTAIDMETAAVARVCEERGCRWAVFRGISDDAFDPSVDEAVLALSRPDGTPDLGAVARYVARRPTPGGAAGPPGPRPRPGHPRRGGRRPGGAQRVSRRLAASGPPPAAATATSGRWSS